MPRLVIVSGAEPGKAVELAAAELLIGRQPGLGLQLEGQKVSRRHARVLRQGDAYKLEDLGSSNGTFLNGTRLKEPAVLKSWDEIGVGNYLLRYEATEVAPEFTIHARAEASTANPELYRSNAGRKLEIILKLSADLGRSLQVSDLLNQVLDHLFVLFPQTERGLVILLEGGRPVLRAQKQRRGVSASGQFSSSIVQRVATEGVGLLAEDPQTDIRFAEAQSIISLGLRSFICVPLPTKAGKALGVLQLERTGGGHKFTPEDLNLLTAVGLQVAVALDNAQLHQELIARERIESEVALAREIQLSYLPTVTPELPGDNFDLHAELLPAYEISGDFYDYFAIGANRLAIAVADVCGKGIPAAMFMSMVRALLRNFAERESDPGIVLRELNNAVTRQNPKCQFVTISFCVFDPVSKILELSSAGHPPPLLRRQNGSVEVVSVRQGPLLGYAEQPWAYPKTKVELHAGELLLLYTDGVTEAVERQSVMFGTDRLRTALAELAFPDQLRQWTASLRSAIHSFTESPQLDDDITLALLRVK